MTCIDGGRASFWVLLFFQEGFRHWINCDERQEGRKGNTLYWLEKLGERRKGEKGDVSTAVLEN